MEKRKIKCFHCGEAINEKEDLDVVLTLFSFKTFHKSSCINKKEHTKKKTRRGILNYPVHRDMDILIYVSFIIYGIFYFLFDGTLNILLHASPYIIGFAVISVGLKILSHFKFKRYFRNN